MKTHYRIDERKTACGRTVKRFAVDNYRPSLSLSTDWSDIDCSQCLRIRNSSIDEAVEIAPRTWYKKDDPLHFNPHHPLGKLAGEWRSNWDKLKPGSERGEQWMKARD